jgi:hypothetical protein
MGAWGAGSFDNDTACDWSYDLEETDDLSLIENALGRVLDARDEYLDAMDAEEALAAAEVIARLQGNFGEKNAYTEPVDEWVAENPLTVTPELAKKSHAAIERIMGAQSELAELWEESESFDEWKAAVAELKGRIRV